MFAGKAESLSRIESETEAGRGRQRQRQKEGIFDSFLAVTDLGFANHKNNLVFHPNFLFLN
jgi:hypothetical protein